MKPLDTSDEAWGVQQAIWRRMGPAKRVELALRMSDDARAVSIAGVAARHPTYTAEQARHAVYRMTLGDELYSAAWPGRPLLDP